MIPDLRDLYQQVILDHSKQPRNFRTMPDATHQAEGYNPLCGDRVKVFLRVRDHTIRDASFIGAGCAICTASASMMTKFLPDKTVDEARDAFNKFRDLVMGQVDAAAVAEDLDKLAVFEGVRQFPIRVKCATLPWHTMKAAVDREPTLVSTE